MDQKNPYAAPEQTDRPKSIGRRAHWTGPLLWLGFIFLASSRASQVLATSTLIVAEARAFVDSLAEILFLMGGFCFAASFQLWRSRRKNY